jgi:spore coat protein A
VRMHPGEVITLAMKFTLPNVPFTVPSSTRNNLTFLNPLPAGSIVHEYVYHCHILEHEEHDMMRPWIVVS